MIFCEIRRDLFSLGLKVTSQVATHRVNLKRSVYKQIAAAMGLSTTIKRLLSSVKMLIFRPIVFTILLMLVFKSC